MNKIRQERVAAKVPSDRKAAASPAKGVLAPARATRVRIRRQWAWHYRVLLKLRDRLRSERSTQLNEAAEPLEPHSMDLADTATDELDHDLALAHLSAEQDALFEVEQALGRIRDGTYGVCEETGQKIPAARLRAVPWARFCRAAQARLEQNGAVKRERLGQPASLRKSPAEAFEEAESQGESSEPSKPEDEALWNVRTPAAERSRRGRSSPGKRAGR